MTSIHISMHMTKIACLFFNRFGNIDKLKSALQLHDHNDFLIVLAQAEKLKPGLIEKLHIYSH